MMGVLEPKTKKVQEYENHHNSIYFLQEYSKRENTH